MCLAVPALIVELDGDMATIDVGGVRRIANLSFIDNPAIGEYVLVHAGFAIKKWTTEDVEEFNQIMGEIEQALGEQ